MVAPASPWVGVWLAMMAFASNSLLCRSALAAPSRIDPSSFTSIRLATGALVLAALCARRERLSRTDLRSAAASGGLLFFYAAPFSLAYGTLDAGTGALLLFAFVQLTMIAGALWESERIRRPQGVGFAVAFAGLIVLLWRGAAAPSGPGVVSMAVAGVAWGLYSLRGRRTGRPLARTAASFVLSLPPMALLLVGTAERVHLTWTGVALAAVSGGIASGLGYAVWHSVLPGIRAVHAAVVQLSVPVLAALGGVVVLGEELTSRTAAATPLVLGGVALATHSVRRFPREARTGSRPRPTRSLA